MTCNNYCTADECFQLRLLIEDLQSQVINLTNELFQHTQKSIPDAHAYSPTVEVTADIVEANLNIAVAVGEGQGAADVSLEEAFKPNVTCEVLQQDRLNYVIKVGVNDSFGEGALILTEPELEFTITESQPWNYDVVISLGEQSVTQSLGFDLQSLLDELAKNQNDNSLDIEVSYLANFLTITISDGTNSDTGKVYIDAEVINNYGGGGGLNNNDEGGGMSCEGMSEQLDLSLEAILAAIAELRTKVVDVENHLTIDVKGTVVTDLECPTEEPEEGAPPALPGSETEYEYQGLEGLHQLLLLANNNLVSIFKRACEDNNVVAFPAWWQVRLGASTPQIVCSFRKGTTRTYHSLSIPHPASTEKPKSPLLPQYTKGNWQGMVTCIDNSKFIINCNSEAEANRMCSLAIGLIDSNFLESPPRVYVAQRKGQGVGVNVMFPTTVEYFETGQKHTLPKWRARVTEKD